MRRSILVKSNVVDAARTNPVRHASIRTLSEPDLGSVHVEVRPVRALQSRGRPRGPWGKSAVARTGR